MSVHTRRLREDIETNAEFGAVDVDEGRGRTVLPGTDANRRAREYLCERLRDANLDVRIDSVGNVVGRWTPAEADPRAAPVAAGSHLDSVPMGGIFDGPLGVYGALEAVRDLQERAVDVSRPIDVVCFTEEEGSRFSDGLLGSSVATGKRTVEDALALTDEEGTTLESALDDIGFLGESRIDAAEWNAWLELHVEQSRRLERANVPVGVVTSITGMTRCTVSIEGEANHAGTTPMGDRHDSLAAASEVVLDVESVTNEVVDESSESAVGTVGQLDVSPNAVNVVPGQVDLRVDVRDVDYESMETIVRRLQSSLDNVAADRGVATTFDRPYDVRPTPMADRCVDALETASEARGVETMRLHSGAGHDTIHVGDVTDAAMLFAPSRDGISHSPLEWTDWEDCARAVDVLAGGLERLARQ